MNESDLKRPWDKAFSRPPESFTSRGKSDDDIPSDVNSTTPFVLVDGTPYYSDRFYLNTPTGCRTPPSSSSRESDGDDPVCECRAPPPLFDRSRLVGSLDLVAVVASTYVIDADWLRHELPALFPPPDEDETEIKTETGFDSTGGVVRSNGSGCVPTLVLHGHRGLKKKKKKKCASKKRPEPQVRPRHRSEKEDVNCDSFLKTNTSEDGVTMEKFKKDPVPDTVKDDCVEDMPLDPVASIEPRHDKHGPMRGQTHAGGRKNTDLTDSFGRNATDNTMRDRRTDNLTTSTSNRLAKEVVIIEIDDESDVESESSNDEIQVIKCVPAPLNKRKTRKVETSRSHNHRNTPRRSVASLAAKHQKALYQSPVYKHGTTDMDTDQESEVENEMVYVPITPLSISDARLDDVPPEEGWRHGVRVDDKEAEIIEGDTGNSIFGKSVYLTEILPRWIPPTDPTSLEIKAKRAEEKCSRVASNDVIDLVDDFSSEADGIGVDPEIVARRKSCVGVHHPKYMLLFERCGSVVIIVSTSNLTSPSAVDGSWIQRFEPRSQQGNGYCKSTDSTESDFGYVLCDFLNKQSDAAKERQILPIQFLRKYLCEKLGSLDDFRLRYRFDQARVHLVSTVPGCFRRRVRYSRTRRRVVYGPQRVAEITSRLSNNKAISSADRLILQTTSFGCNWKSRSFEDLIRIYLGLDNNDPSYIHARKNLLDRVDVVWPSQDFIESVVSARRQVLCDDLTAESCPGLSPENFTFLSTKAFNSIDLECVSCMAQYEPCNPSPIAPWVLSPHIKTVARVLQASPRHDANSNEEGRDSADFAWVMLTSACLSRGAQGIAVEEKGFEREHIIHTNFELGVLFCSRTGDSNKADKLYSCYPTKCSCHKKSKNNQRSHFFGSVIPLPIPYKIQPQPYQLDPDEADFTVTPCFHEITPGTEVTGQMMLTPFGKRLSIEHQCNSTISRLDL